MVDGFSSVFYSAPDGLKLHARVYGEENRHALPVICLAGLTRNARDFHELALALSGPGASIPRKVVAFDYRGRGRSGYDPNWKTTTRWLKAPMCWPAWRRSGSSTRRSSAPRAAG